MNGSEIDLSEISDEMAREILRQGEMHVEALLSSSIAVDQKAINLAGIFAIILTAVLGGFVIIVTGKEGPLAILISAIVTATMLFAGVVLCVVASWPSKFHIVGNEPKNWLEPSVAHKPIIEAIVGEAQNCQDKIDFNKAVLRKQTRVLGWGAHVGFLAPAVGIAVWAGVMLLETSAADEGAAAPSRQVPIVQDAQ